VGDRAGQADEVVDLGAEAEIRGLAERLLERHGRVDVLVNNAAQLGIHRLDELTWRRGGASRP